MFSIDDYPSTTTAPVSRAIMLQRWDDVTFVHWPFDPDPVQSRLPNGLRLDTFDGRAWVGLVAFRMRGIRLPFLPPIPYFGSFPETNVRTYVRGPDGTPGVWFDSLDITRMLPVLVARSSYRLPYRWSDMDIERTGETITYTATTRWPAPRHASSRLAVGTGGLRPADGELERFLTARWGLYSAFGTSIAYAPVDHPAWPLREAELTELDDELVLAAGYPIPQGEPLVHYASGVPVRVGLPRRIEF